MPRHRIEARRQRTLWPGAVQSARRVRFLDAGRRGTPGHAKPAVAAEWRQRLTRSQRRMLKRAGRRLLVSPWFAAGAGFVIATGAIIYVPHTNLDFGNAIHVIHCKQAQCRQSVPEQAPGMAAGIGGEQITVSPSAPTVPVGMTFRYQVLDQSEYEFSIQITIRARQDPGPWKLSFVIPGARHVYVYGAPAQLFGVDGVTVNSVGARTQSASYAQISGHELGGAGEFSQSGYTVQFQVRGMGTPGTPSQCTFNGAPCTFKGLRDLAPAG